ncbi:hypothetical protein D3P09_03245 [Paenibacillus pinisoli]|uniref:DUF4209 domain-containing protein n=1 Tax=Paenibacillus pinisoli TaxID=1276110 RepID=A0A3A6PW36_9BACL|nr:hypothetical protein [Paenibacillus pinisoli]RJX41041.1 hypothetical protein D3P09_03245 [Paenibacillus pinisoli]
MVREKLSSDKVRSQFARFQQFQDANKLQMESVKSAFQAITESFQVSLPKIVIPKVEFSLNWEGFSEEFAEECRNNAKYGWCLSSEMGVAEYREIARSKDSQEVKDEKFVSMFEEEEFALYKAEKEFIISKSSEEWKILYEDCFNAFENELHRLAIPSLIMGIEHELFVISNSDMYGMRLIRKVKSDFEEGNSDSTLTYALNAPVFSVLENSLFKTIPFESERPTIINRNWVLHGRDDPTSWSKIEIYKLMTIISAIKLI